MKTLFYFSFLKPKLKQNPPPPRLSPLNLEAPDPKSQERESDKLDEKLKKRRGTQFRRRVKGQKS